MDEVVYVLIPASREPLSYNFFMALHKATVEAGVKVVWGITRHYGVAEARNMGVEQALNLGATHVLFLDDDVVPQVNPITSFLQARVPVACGLYYEKNMRGTNLHAYRRGKWRNLRVDEVRKLVAKWGYAPVDACGLGLAMVEADVFEKLSKPWFVMAEGMGEDIYFFAKLRKELGIRPVAFPHVYGIHIMDSRFYITEDGKIRLGSL